MLQYKANSRVSLGPSVPDFYRGTDSYSGSWLPVHRYDSIISLTDQLHLTQDSTYNLLRKQNPRATPADPDDCTGALLRIEVQSTQGASRQPHKETEGTFATPVTLYEGWSLPPRPSACNKDTLVTQEYTVHGWMTAFRKALQYALSLVSGSWSRTT